VTVTRPGRGQSRIGVDIGGTFTDLVLLSDGRVQKWAKVLTTPQDPSLGVEHGIYQLLADHRPADITEVVHGTTLVPNALIERKGATTALVTTRGFRDVLGIGREHRYDLYDLFLEMPEPLVPRRLRWEIRERVLADGTVEESPDPEEVEEVADRARGEGVEALAVSLLHSYRHAGHEQLLGRLLKDRLPDLPISLSSDVSPELGEFARTSTTVANAYVLPLMDRYLEMLEKRLDAAGLQAPLHIMLSTGGLADVATARRYPIRLVESGPAAGALAATFFGAQSDRSDVLAFDVGGTTAKACLVENGVPLVAREHEVARVYRFAKGSGLPLRVPVIDMVEIGAGGGSIAAAGPLGLPKVGPESAGAEPGPACYGQGGERPTVTDADLILGYLDPNSFLGGEIKLDVGAARASMGHLADELGISTQQAAAAIHRVVNENMAGAARIHAVERGRDLRRFSMVATGGAGPVHAWGVARALSIDKLVFPPRAGLASAFGMLTAPPSFEFARSLPAALSEVPWDEVRRIISSLAREGAAQLQRAGAEQRDIGHSVAADVRYKGQGSFITVELGHELGRDPRRNLEDSFAHMYENLYGKALPGVETEVLTWRVRVFGPRPELGARATAGAGTAEKGRRPVWFAEVDGFVDTSVWDRAALSPGDEVGGPAVIEEPESTVVIGPRSTARVVPSGSLEVDVGARS
jgi:N-methylhydantoinase A